MSRLSKYFVFLGIVAIGLIYAIGIGHGQDCGTTKDWKDIYILPTNPNPQNNIKITLSAEKQSLKPGDELNLTFTADRECYLTLMDMGTSGKILRLWPNDYSGTDNRIDPNSHRKFPGPGDKFKFRIAGPDGVERLIAYATSEKGKILSEQEFQQLKNTGFKEYPGSAKDLAIHFQRSSETVGSKISWGTAQLNVCIGSGPPPPAATQTTVPSRVYLLTIAGHGKFDDRPYDNTVDRMAETLQSKAGIEKSNVRILKDAEADYQGVSSGMRWLASSTQPEDMVVIYFSGHGGNHNGEGFLVLYPGQQKNMTKKDHLRKKICLTKNEFGAFLKKIPARKKILIVDSCHSRAISKGLRIDDGEISDYLPWGDLEEEEWTMGDKSSPPSYGNDHEALLASARKHESSFSYPRLNGGAFTYFLVEAIKHGSPNLDEAFSLAKENIESWYRKLRKNDPPVPCIVDPHGLAKDFRFQN
jgi:hypothetical protein